MATKKVRTRTIGWDELVRRVDRKQPQDRPVVYRFANRRRFRERRDPYQTF